MYIELLPLWEHGLKPGLSDIGAPPYHVAPFMGAWIETALLISLSKKGICCSLYGSMDWNNQTIKIRTEVIKLLPLWEHGLKH